MVESNTESLKRRNHSFRTDGFSLSKRRQNSAFDKRSWLTKIIMCFLNMSKVKVKPEEEMSLLEKDSSEFKMRQT